MKFLILMSGRRLSVTLFALWLALPVLATDNAEFDFKADGVSRGTTCAALLHTLNERKVFTEVNAGDLRDQAIQELQTFRIKKLKQFHLDPHAKEVGTVVAGQTDRYRALAGRILGLNHRYQNPAEGDDQRMRAHLFRGRKAIIEFLDRWNENVIEGTAALPTTVRVDIGSDKTRKLDRFDYLMAKLSKHAFTILGLQSLPVTVLGPWLLMIEPSLYGFSVYAGAVYLGVMRPLALKLRDHKDPFYDLHFFERLKMAYDFASYDKTSPDWIYINYNKVKPDFEDMPRAFSRVSKNEMTENGLSKIQHMIRGQYAFDNLGPIAKRFYLRIFHREFAEIDLLFSRDEETGEPVLTVWQQSSDKRRDDPPRPPRRKETEDAEEVIKVPGALAPNPAGL